MLKLKIKMNQFTPQVHEALNELQHLGHFELHRCEGGVCYFVDYMDSKILPIFMSEEIEIHNFIGAVQVPLSKLDEIVSEDFPCSTTEFETVELVDEIETKTVNTVAVRWRDYAVCEEGLSDAIIMIGQYDMDGKNYTVCKSDLFYKFVEMGSVLTKSEIALWRTLNTPQEEMEEIV